MRRAGQSNVMILHNSIRQGRNCGTRLFLLYKLSHAGSILIRTLSPGESLPSAFRLPRTESGVPLRPCGVELRGTGPFAVTSA
jgi:hypothetical protein